MTRGSNRVSYLELCQVNSLLYCGHFKKDAYINVNTLPVGKVFLESCVWIAPC